MIKLTPTMMIRPKPKEPVNLYESDTDEESDAEDSPEIIPTRYGYNIVDFLTNYQQVFLQQGTLGWGRILHLTADMICSEGFDKWRSFTYSYALDHIGLGSLRVFVYLHQRHEELSRQRDKYPTEALYGRPDFQRTIGEIALILNTQPRKSRPPIPRVPVTVLGEEWIHTQRKPMPTAAVRRIWNHGTDSIERAVAANHMLGACEEAATEKALFWMKWSLDEDKRKLKAKANIDSNKRGGGVFLCRCLHEAYKELAAQQKIRMHEEYQTLIEMFLRDGNYYTARQRNDMLVLMVQIISEIPRLKVPAAVQLAKDDIALKLATAQTSLFFKEVLAKPQVDPKIWKYAKRRAAKPVEKKIVTQEEQIDQLYKSFYKNI